MKVLSVIVMVLLALPLIASEAFPSAAGPINITIIQHASLMLEAGGKVVYIDPAQGSYEGRPKADYIFLTDIHGDHLAPAIVARLQKAGTVIVAPAAVAEKVPGATVMANGQTTAFGPFEVEAIAMYNIERGPSPGKLFHERGRGNAYVIAFGGKRFYISGDTEAIPEMKGLRKIDVAFVCMNLPYTMTLLEAAEGVRAFHPAVVYPYHYRGSDVNAFAKALEGTGIEVRPRDWYAK